MFQAFHTLILVLVGVTLPFGYTNVDLGFVVLTPAKVASSLLLVLVAAEIGLAPRRASKLGWRSVWLALFLVSVGASTAISIFTGLPASFVTTTSVTWLSLVAITALLSYTLNSGRHVRLVIAAYTVGALYVAVTGLAGFGFTTSSAEGLRTGGEGGNSNEAAFHLVLGVASAFAMMQTTTLPRMRVFWSGTAVVLIVAVGATLSRSGILALLFMAALWTIRFRRFDIFRVAIPAVLLVGLAITLMPGSVADRLETMAPSKANQDTSILSRKETLPLALQAFGENPVVGVGISGWLRWAVQHRAAYRDVIHNSHLHVAAEQGLLGLVPFTALTVMAWLDFSRTWRFGRRRGRTDPLLRDLGTQATYLQLGYLGCLVVSQFQPAMRYKGLWLCFALSAVVVSLARARAAEVARHGPAGGETLAVAAAARA
jgi:O-antigen ligase